ncbi:hypothetical protein [Roseateles oligotrophus]|uniref:Peptidase S9 prolyl oligopeptidase catalytic domain-containing protein n=1 Tax=Roseateles oligotrophus TaxID=1769250 RepID=A0ABT2YC12_9BURK|nr:hypothetical protein [Roseateles oligotrophus]MCV2367475.1 hypothetical protein [Roseateles oligotrophus]
MAEVEREQGTGPRIGGSAKFRELLRAELIPQSKVSAGQAKPLIMTIGNDDVIGPPALQFAEILQQTAAPSLPWKFVQMSDETHTSLYHPGGLAGHALDIQTEQAKTIGRNADESPPGKP